MSPYATQEDPKSLWYEQSIYVSTHLAAVGYGIHLAIFSMVTYHTLKQKQKFKSRAWIGWLVFNTFLFAMGTINLACSINFNENAWINDREYPGGPFAYLIGQQTLPVITLGNVTSILASFLADALLLYRTAMLWNYVWYIIIPPTLFYIACVILSILTTVQIALPTQTHWHPLSLAVWIILMILPMWLTALIAVRILYQKKRMADMLGEEDAKAYTGVTAIVIESALPFTIISIILLGLFGDNNVAQNLFVPLMVQIECIAPEMIILRVMLGRAWTRQAMVNNQVPRSEMQFAAAPRPITVESMFVATVSTGYSPGGTPTARNRGPGNSSVVSLEDYENGSSNQTRNSGEQEKENAKVEVEVIQC